jgi:dTDP-4-dehydrorhamnose reductase
MTPAKVLVLGAAGQLGAAAVRRLRTRTDVVALARPDLDLTDRVRVEAVLDAERPALVLNCAAYNAVDRAEDDPVTALAVNAFAVHTVARASVEVGATFVHYSTDFVFDGRADRPYVETDRPNPLGVYGQSKLIGEWLALEAPGAFVLRVESLFGGPAGGSSVDRIADALASGATARVFTDRVVSPSYVDDVVDATWGLMSLGAAPGVYHVVNTGMTTWFDLGTHLAGLLGAEPRLEAVRTSDVPMRAARPRFCALSNAKLCQAGVEMPAWTDALDRYVNARRR